MRKFLFLFIVSLLLSSCSFTKKEHKYDMSNVVIPSVDHEYFEVEEKHLLFNQIFDVNLKIYFVYFYSLTCNHCQELKNWIIEKALSRNDIFFVRSTNEITLKNDVFSTIGATFYGDISILGYPTLLQINNKILVKNVAGETKIQELLY